MKKITLLLTLAASLAVAAEVKVADYKHIYVFAQNENTLGYLDILGQKHYIKKDTKDCEVGSNTYFVNVGVQQSKQIKTQKLLCSELLKVNSYEAFKLFKRN
jgi:hypothetical protein